MDVVALGELLIDFTENGTSAQDNKLFEIMSIPLLHLSRPQQTETEISHFTEIREQI